MGLTNLKVTMDMAPSPQVLGPVRLVSVAPIPLAVPQQHLLLTETLPHGPTSLQAPRPTPLGTLQAPHPTPLGTLQALLHLLETHQVLADLHTPVLRESLRSTTITTRSPSVM